MRGEVSVDEVFGLGLFLFGKSSPVGLIAESLGIDVTRSLYSADLAVLHGAGRLVRAALTRACSATLSAAALLFHFLDDLIQGGEHLGLLALDALAASSEVQSSFHVLHHVGDF